MSLQSDELSHGGLAEVDFEQNTPQQFGIMSESSSDTIHCMELDVKEYTLKEEIIVVKRIIREAREQAFTEAREIVERAAVERANAEVRQRVMVDALEKIAKASSDQTSAQSKLRVEHGEVERVTAEA
ncbi:hypothetical protein Tco_1026122 [Tanacetum coccineum]